MVAPRPYASRHRVQAAGKSWRCRHFLILVGFAALVVGKKKPRRSLEEKGVTNIRHTDPENYIPVDQSTGKPVVLWSGDYEDVKVVSCTYGSSDFLFDWNRMKRAMILWLKEAVHETPETYQLFWENIRPIQHRFTNIIANHNTSTSRDCLLGLLAMRVFYLSYQTKQYREQTIIDDKAFMFDWFYFTHKFSWSTMVKSGWASVIFPSLHIAAGAIQAEFSQSKWIDCPSLPGLEDILGHNPFTDDPQDGDVYGLMFYLTKAVPDFVVQECPVALAYLSLVTVYLTEDTSTALQFFDLTQALLRSYVEANDHTLVNLMLTEWPMWPLLAELSLRLGEETGADDPVVCKLAVCPRGQTPDHVTCSCRTVFNYPEAPNVTVCFFMVDSRPRASLRNISAVLSAKYWSLAYGANKLYADEQGYELEYVVPDPVHHYPGRKVGWAKLKIVAEKLREYGPERCTFGVSIDTDAYMRTSESLSPALFHYGLFGRKHVLISAEYHTEFRDDTYANGGFVVARNTELGIAILEEWYNVPENYEDMRHLKKNDSQGLNLCWDKKMQPKYEKVTALGADHLFTTPTGAYVRHNWFKDLDFEQELQDVVLQRLQQRYGCIVCQHVYDWENLTLSNLTLRDFIARKIDN